MRKKMLLLSAAAMALIGAFATSPSSAVGGVCQTTCTQYADGSECCHSCWGKWPNCGCTNNYCPPADGE